MLYPFGGILTQILHALWRKRLGAIDRWTDPPIMHQRINAGSDRYFEWRAEHEGDSPLDEILDMGNQRGEDDKD